MRKVMFSIFLFTCFYSFAGKYHPIHTGTVALEGNRTLKEVGAAIQKALIGRGWEVGAKEKGEIHATLNVRTHVAEIKISFDRQQVTIEYVDSANLGYRVKKGVAHIHRNYNRWINYLERDIAVFLV